jgi:hypothetical protein
MSNGRHFITLAPTEEKTMTQMNESRKQRTPKEKTENRDANETVNDLEAKAAPQVKGGRRISADPDEGGEVQRPLLRQG